MEDFALLGNAAAVPIIMGATQLLKKNLSFKYKADVVSFVVALIICPLWWFYNTPEAEIHDALDDGIVPTIKFIMQLVLISIATWLSATKSYDLFAGNKKRETQHDAEKEELHEKIAALQSTLDNGGKLDEEPTEETDVSDKLLDILEGRD